METNYKNNLMRNLRDPNHNDLEIEIISRKFLIEPHYSTNSDPWAEGAIAILRIEGTKYLFIGSPSFENIQLIKLDS